MRVKVVAEIGFGRTINADKARFKSRTGIFAPGYSEQAFFLIVLYRRLSCGKRSYLPSVSLKSASIRFHESSSAALSYFMPGLPTLSASATVKLWTAPG